MLATFAVSLIKVHKVTVSGDSLEKHSHLALKLGINLGSKGNDVGLVYGVSLTVEDLVNQDSRTQVTRPGDKSDIYHYSL